MIGMAARSPKSPSRSRKRGTVSMTDQHAPRGRHFADDGRKIADLERVGSMAPDTDPDDTPPQTRRTR